MTQELKSEPRTAPRASLTETIRQKYQDLEAAGKIPAQDQVERELRSFHERFSPAALARLDGTTLLEAMHDHGNRDSLVYWLEFKNDEEFATSYYGSIAGGSALKFRLFRRKETGLWQAGGKKGNQPVTISTEDAVAMARTHRDQLSRGAEILEKLPLRPTEADYVRLQERMETAAPDLSHLGWSHKYFSLLFPDHLDKYHLVDLQHHLLLKLLQLPPQGQGLFLSAARFRSLAEQLGIPLLHLGTVLPALLGAWHRYWRVGTRSGDASTSYWEMMRERSCIAVGWRELPELSWVKRGAEFREKLKQLHREHYPHRPAAAVGNECSQLMHLIVDISEGDTVLAADGGRILGIGRVTGGYEYHPEFGFPHQRRVEWLDLEPWKLPILEGLRSTVREIRKHPENLLEVERRIQTGSRPNFDPVDPTPRPDRRLSGVPGRIQSILERKGQVILYGPPGTGKTFHAERTARDLAALQGYGKLFDALTESEQQPILGDGQRSGQVRLCCFHPAYGYEDFLEGYRPESRQGQIAFTLRDGVFKQLCRDATAQPDRPFYLIVDEINRGDIPRIFGELLTILEKDKRGKRIILPVSQQLFSVPENVYLIGTMNTADRSISLLDAALRRRFGFVELMPDSTVLGNAVIGGIPLRAWLDDLNRRIREFAGRDARNLQIGHSYLMQNGNPLRELAALKRALRDDILPLLEEYCYEDYHALGNILGEQLVEVAAARLRQEFFEDGQEEQLIQALLAPCPQLATSLEVISSAAAAGEEEAGELEELDEDADQHEPDGET